MKLSALKENVSTHPSFVRHRIDALHYQRKEGKMQPFIIFYCLVYILISHLSFTLLYTFSIILETESKLCWVAKMQKSPFIIFKRKVDLFTFTVRDTPFITRASHTHYTLQFSKRYELVCDKRKGAFNIILFLIVKWLSIKPL